jgi:FkbM family methyltransferase
MRLNLRLKWYFWPLLAVALFLVPRMFMGPERRTETYFAFQRRWIAHWPWERGRYAPILLLPAVLPWTPVWYEFEPHVKLWLDPEDMGPYVILSTGQYEDPSFSMVREHLSAGATFVDVGANYGIYSLRAAPIVGPAGRVIAVEPNPESVRRLEVNIRASDARMVTVAPVACSDAEGMLELYVAPRRNTGGTSLSRTNASQDGAVSRTYHVRARPLDDIIRESGVTRVDAIKIDVEGAEYLVLQGARQTLNRFHPMLLLEVVDRQLRAMGTSAAELREFLRANGYREGRHTELNVEFLATGSGISAPRSDRRNQP